MVHGFRAAAAAFAVGLAASPLALAAPPAGVLAGWSFPVEGPLNTTAPAVADGLMLVADTGGELLALPVP